MEAVFPAAASALARGRRKRTPGERARRRTLPVTFAEIKEVDEDGEEGEKGSAGGARALAPSERRRPDVLDDQLARFADFRRRRARPGLLSERNEDLSASSHAADAAPAPADAPAPSAAPCVFGSAPHLADT